MTSRGGSVDPTAEVDAGVSVGDDVSIGGRARVRAGARLGDRVVVGRDALIDSGVAVGAGSTVRDRALVYAGTTIGEGVYVGPGAIVTNERNPRAVTRAADLGEPPTSAPVVLQPSSTIGAGAVIVAGVEVGPFAMVGPGAVVTGNVTGHAFVTGNPARRLGWVCACGQPLVDAQGDPAPAEPAQYALDTGLTCPSCGRVYGYVPDADTLEERTRPRPVPPA